MKKSEGNTQKKKEIDKINRFATIPKEVIEIIFSKFIAHCSGMNSSHCNIYCRNNKMHHVNDECEIRALILVCKTFNLLLLDNMNILMSIHSRLGQ